MSIVDQVDFIGKNENNKYQIQLIDAVEYDFVPHHALWVSGSQLHLSREVKRQNNVRIFYMIIQDVVNKRRN